ncbi:hypothetical protein BKA70DRAFT_1159128 [Coprinopsis sp. MPI-PUGE-AT-0042]|nr:hypothetical protein BKA70DRAFT_1159128 [Coprinopsis sp. MPI-PUGE-AT-0042]
MSFPSFPSGEPTDEDRERLASSLTAIITSAVHDEAPEISLAEVYRQLAQNNGVKYLDALDVLPVLLQRRDPAARDIVSLITECSSAKEAVIAAQEALERLQAQLEGDDDDDIPSAIDTLIEIVNLYATAMPKISLRKKTAFETALPHVTEVQGAIEHSGQHLSKAQSRVLLSSVSLFIESVYKWVEGKDSSKGEAKDVLRNLLFSTLLVTVPRLDAGLAQRTFESLYPRLTIRSQKQDDFQDAEEAISAAWSASKLLGLRQQDLLKEPSPTSLAFLAHLEPSDLSEPALLSSLMPILIACIQTNNIIDQTLSLLLKVLHSQKEELPMDVIAPLLSVFPMLASGHPDPQARHQAFRILGLLLSRSPPPLRMQVLQDLTTDDEFPQMRVAAVGLVKDAVLEALTSSSDNIFASAAFLRTFGPILLRPNPPDVFQSSPSIKDFEESHESKRLVECLSLYYILLLRDKSNLTGIRDQDVLRNVENNLLTPVRQQLEKWSVESSGSDDHLHDIMPLVSLQMGLDRVDAARGSLNTN